MQNGAQTNSICIYCEFLQWFGFFDEMGSFWLRFTPSKWCMPNFLAKWTEMCQTFHAFKWNAQFQKNTESGSKATYFEMIPHDNSKKQGHISFNSHSVCVFFSPILFPILGFLIWAFLVPKTWVKQTIEQEWKMNSFNTRHEYWSIDVIECIERNMEWE